MLTHTDPLDQLVPPPRQWWFRLAVGVAIVGSVGALSFLWGYGYLHPRPECCGSGSASPTLSLSDDRAAVVLTTSFFNSSGRDLEIRAATADLPGARVVDVSATDGGFFPAVLTPLPAVVGGTDMARLAITFVPERCDDPTGEWGTLELDLAVVHTWLPSLPRTYALPDPVVTGDDLAVLTPTGEAGHGPDPLAAACALLDDARG